MAKTSVPESKLKKVKSTIIKKADEFGYLTRSHIENGTFMDNLVNDPDVGGILKEYMPKESIRTYIKDGVLNAYTKSKAKQIMSSYTPELVIQKVYNKSAMVIQTCNGKQTGVFVLRSSDNEIFVIGTLRAQMKLPNTPIKTDSYIAVQSLEQQKNLDIKSVGEMAELVEGSFVFTVLDEKNNMYFVKGDNPLALYHYEKYGFYIYASTGSILDRALAELGILRFEHTEINTNCGDIIKIESTGAMERGLFDTSNLYAFDYRFLRSSYWDYPDPAEHEPQDVKQLKDFAASIGINREDIDLLLCYGYFVEEIEEMLYHPGEFEQAIAEILNECAYDYCGEF